MTSIGINKSFEEMFPAGVILMQIDLSDRLDDRERMLVEEYQTLAKEAKELGKVLWQLQDHKGRWVRCKIRRTSKKYTSKRKRMQQIEESKALSTLLFHKRSILMAKQREQEKKLEEERTRRYIEAMIRQECMQKEPVKQTVEPNHELNSDLAKLRKLETDLIRFEKAMQCYIKGTCGDDTYRCSEAERKQLEQSIEENDIMPQKYKSQFVVRFLIQAIESRRVDSVAKALELYEKKREIVTLFF